MDSSNTTPYNSLPVADYDPDHWTYGSPFDDANVITPVESPISPIYGYGEKSRSLGERMEFISSSQNSPSNDTPEEEPEEDENLHWFDRELDKFLIWFKKYRTFTLIVGFYFAGVLLGVLHYFFNDMLDGKKPEDTWEQKTVTYIAVALVNLSKACIAAGLGVAYIQVVWYNLRRRWTNARLIDRLLSLPWSPGDLVYMRSTFWRAPFEWVFALFVLSVPLVLSVPPSSMKLGMAALQPYNLTTQIPIVDLTYRMDQTFTGNDPIALYVEDQRTSRYRGTDLIMATFEEPFENPEEIGFTNFHTEKVKNVATSVIRHAEIEPWENPVASHPKGGANASYTFHFTGPRYHCSHDKPVQWNPNPKSEKSNEYALNLEPNATVVANAIFRSERPIYRMLGNELKWTVLFQKRYRKPRSITTYERAKNLTKDQAFEGLFTNLTSITCELGLTNYTVKVEYINNIGSVSQTYDGTWERIEPSFGLTHYFMKPYNFSGDANPNQEIMGFEAEATVEMYRWAEYNYYTQQNFEVEKVPDDSEAEFEKPGTPPRRKVPLRRRYLELQARGISEAMFRVLHGDIIAYGLREQENIWETLVLQSPVFTNTTATEPGWIDMLGITPPALEQTLANITAALPNLNFTSLGWNTTTDVLMTPWAYVYQFDRKLLLWPYFSIFAVALPFAISGLFALQSNGVSSSKGFLQVVSTTTGSEALRAAAAECCLGGEENFERKLCKLKLKFGDLIQAEEEWSEKICDKMGVKKGPITAYTSGVDQERLRERRGWLTTMGTRDEVEKMHMTEERRTIGDAYGLFRVKRRQL
ncbi:hypothetical protein BJ508DRAFT_414089 [Ascobolus immersus RN42]|uniref:Uncharacterized protein n=1 Tax=Ascobolus immersus RN42 TaxID=1160509 RepID=A0A3N4I8N4_ASCIM|nr:hypothetical protein BJ508DRAFT_414089 [Ascobolus immersus RN42]